MTALAERGIWFHEDESLTRKHKQGIRSGAASGPLGAECGRRSRGRQGRAGQRQGGIGAHGPNGWVRWLGTSGLTDWKEERVPCCSIVRGLHVCVVHFHAALASGTEADRASPRFKSGLSEPASLGGAAGKSGEGVGTVAAIPAVVDRSLGAPAEMGWKLKPAEGLKLSARIQGLHVPTAGNGAGRAGAGRCRVGGAKLPPWLAVQESCRVAWRESGTCGCCRPEALGGLAGGGWSRQRGETRRGQRRRCESVPSCCVEITRPGSRFARSSNAPLLELRISVGERSTRAGCRMLVMIIMMMRMSKKDQWMRRIGRSVGEFPGCVGAQQAAVMLSGIHGAERGTAQRLTPTVGAVSPCELLGWCPAFPERHDWHFPCHARASPNELKLGFVGEHDEIS
jgi:hypothetical protein